MPGTSILDMLSDLGIAVKRVGAKHGGEYASPCPGCGGSDRFHSWPLQSETGRYWCRQCKNGGDAIQFLRDFRGMGYGEACRTLGREVPASVRGRTPRRGRENVKSSWTPQNRPAPQGAWQRRAGDIVAEATRNLADHAPVLEWLAARGIHHETAEAARLGWIGQDLYQPRESWGLARELNAAGRPKKLWIPAGLLIPLDVKGIIHRIRVRRAEPGDGPRYYVLPGSNTRPMLLGEDARAFVVVESELDALLVRQEAEDVAGAIALGSVTARPDADTFARLRKAAAILVALDADEAGGKEAWSWWAQQFPDAIRWPVAEGKDPSEMREKGWSVRDWVLAGLPAGLHPARKKTCVVSLPAPSVSPPPPEIPAGRSEAEAPREEKREAPSFEAARVSRGKLRSPRKSKPEPELVRAYKQGRAWILSNMAELLARGWSRAGLLRAGRFRYPCGPWGLAWCFSWTDTACSGALIEPDGGVTFIISENGRKIRQTSQPS